jgi:ATP-dependent RNA circularization protein (DNA/RNA ligase family)
MSFFKFPRTPHVFIIPGLNIRDDKLLSPQEAALFYNNPVIVEEKVDGANIGISINTEGELQVQNRGNYIRPGEHPQFDTLWEWIYSRAHLLSDILANRYILFGEWCYLVHSISYSSLPDWFIGIDVYDIHEGKFLKVTDRNEFFKHLNIFPVPQIAEGCFSKDQLLETLSHTISRLGADQLEGLYLRLEESQWLLKRAKIVRGDFIQNITKHWKDEVLRKNSLLTQPFDINQFKV